MTIDDIAREYGTAYKFFKAVGMSYNNLVNWRRLGRIPLPTQRRIEEKTNGRLKAEVPDESNS